MGDRAQAVGQALPGVALVFRHVKPTRRGAVVQQQLAAFSELAFQRQTMSNRPRSSSLFSRTQEAPPSLLRKNPTSAPRRRRSLDGDKK